MTQQGLTRLGFEQHLFNALLSQYARLTVPTNSVDLVSSMSGKLLALIAEGLPGIADRLEAEVPSVHALPGSWRTNWEFLGIHD